MKSRRYSFRGLLTAGLVLGMISLLTVMSCARNPVTGSPDFVLTTTEGEVEMGKEAAQQVEQQMGFIQDPALAAYVEAVGQRLSQHSPRQDVKYEFHVVEMPEPNAFALPGGFVYVSRGLLVLTNSEDELAGVIGHEIGHVAARHSVQRMSRAAPFAIVGGITGAVTGIVSSSLSDAVVGITGAAGSLVLAPYSRDQEREADDVGVEMAGAAGWDPGALSIFLNSLEREEELQLGGPRETSFLDTHPATPERVSNTAKHAKTVTRGAPRPVASDRDAFLGKLDGLVVGQDPAEGVFVESQFLQPELDFTMQFPSGWKTENTRQLVAGVEPNQKAFMIVQVAAQGNDPMVVPRELDKKLEGKLLEKVERFKVGNLPAARVVLETRTKAGPTAVDLTWIAHRGLVYQIASVTEKRDYGRYRTAFASSVQSFRPLTSSERSSIEVTRVRIVRAQQGETVEQVVKRTNSSWSGQEAAVANGLQADSSLKSGQMVKVAKRERYLSRP